MIYTSYFAKINKLPSSIVPISIAAKPPAGYKGLQYKKLAPKYDFFMEWKRTHDNEYYIKCFKEQVLDSLTVEGVLKELESLVKDPDKDICLVCYEKPTGDTRSQESQQSCEQDTMSYSESPKWHTDVPHPKLSQEDARNQSDRHFCHRHLVAEWLNDNGVPCVEYAYSLF